MQAASSSSLGSGLFLLVRLGGRGEVLLRNRGHKTVHLLLVRDRSMLETIRAVNAHLSVDSAGQNDWRLSRELDDSLWRVDPAIFVIRRRSGNPIVFGELWLQRVLLEIPNLDTTVISDRCEDRRSVGRPANIIDLLLEAANLMACEFRVTVLLVPDSHGPIIRASEEDGAIVWMPERVAANTVDGSHVSIVVVRVALGERGRALVDGAVFCRHEVVIARVVDREVDRKTASVDEGHAAGLLLVDSASVDVLLVRISLALQLLQVAVLEALLHRPFDDAAVP